MVMYSSWKHNNLEVRESEKHGKGLYAVKLIPKDERLIIFGGDIMHLDEMYDMPEELQEYAMQIEERFVLGYRKIPSAEDTDFINHSCNPNAGIKGQIFLVAMRDIEPDEEITFDYAMNISDSKASDIVFEMECGCGADNCRKIINEDGWKNPELQARYKGYFSQYIQDRINKLNNNSN